MNVLWQEDIKWELDYVKNDLFRGIPLNITYFDLHRQGAPEHAQVMVFNHKFRDKRLVKRIRPDIIILLSEKEGGKPYTLKVAKYCKLFLHAYNHEYNYPKNSLQIPLGYISNYVSFRVKPIIERGYNIAFVGDIKNSDRIIMRREFQKLGNAIFETGKNCWMLERQYISPQEMFEIYNNAIFVPVGRGYRSLDCFRIYEAILAGAIPILVGEKKEMELTFHYNGDSPNLLFFDSWEIASAECKKMLSNKEKLQDMQRDLLDWYERTIKKINTRIRAIRRTSGGGHSAIEWRWWLIVVILIIFFNCWHNPKNSFPYVRIAV